MCKHRRAIIYISDEATSRVINFPVNNSRHYYSRLSVLGKLKFIIFMLQINAPVASLISFSNISNINYWSSNCYTCA